MMNKKLPATIGIITGVIILLLAEFFLVRQLVCPNTKDDILTEESGIETETKPKAMMLLIEFNNTEGLVNMVNDMKEHNVYGILMVNADFVEANKDTIKEILKTGNIEIAASYDKQPYWEMSYDEQYETISDMKSRIENALDIDVRIISSRYMASDMNTVKIADELGIEYITARGTTELATTVYKPEEYDVKIISVSNIDVPEFKYGSFCDYSFYERGGSPEDMTKEFEQAIQEEKFIGVSHTYIGGYKERWNDMWHTFWEDYDVDWVDLDTLGTIDITMPLWQIPINKNAPYTPEKIRPAIPYEDEENVINPCKVENLNDGESSESPSQDDSIDNSVVIFHNNTGTMCLDALQFFKDNSIAYEEHLNTDSDYSTELQKYKANNPTSQGVSTSYEYYPFIFVGGESFSGFNNEIKTQILDLVEQ
ncbi:polysaccharide deacetylase family protein [Candidatus Dojkabacteria bacterium]|nr:polysaccharide deacetylase family protein [Candidatus Dojkabacteria bacterium]